MRRVIFGLLFVLLAGSVSAAQLYTLTVSDGQIAVATVNPVTGQTVPVILTGTSTRQSNVGAGPIRPSIRTRTGCFS